MSGGGETPWLLVSICVAAHVVQCLGMGVLRTHTGDGIRSPRHNRAPLRRGVPNTSNLRWTATVMRLVTLADD
jgi:hypothetical protein